MLLRSLALCLLAFLAACSGPRHSLGLPADQVAVVKGSSRNALKRLGFDADVRIVSVDGKELERSGLSGYPEVVELMPGPHELGINYDTYVDGSQGPSGDARLSLDALAGRTYRIKFGPGTRPMIVTERAGE